MSSWVLIAIIVLVLGVIVSNIMLLKASAKLEIKQPNADIKTIQQQLNASNENKKAGAQTPASDQSDAQ